MKLNKVHCIQVEELNSSIKSFSFQFYDTSNSFSFIPGQWIDLYLEDNIHSPCGGYTLASSCLKKDGVEIVVKESSHPIAQALHKKLKIGDDVWISEAQGRFTTLVPTVTPLLMIAGGIGITPMLGITKSILDFCKEGKQKYPFTLLHSVRLESDLIRKFFFEAQSNIKLFHYVAHLSRKSSRIDLPQLKAILEQMNKISPGANISKVMLCGPGAMNADMKSHLLKLGLNSEQISSEKWH